LETIPHLCKILGEEEEICIHQRKKENVFQKTSKSRISAQYQGDKISPMP